VHTQESHGPALASAAGEHGGLEIAVRSIHKRYAGAIALEDVSVTIERGSIHALVGENGAGKSTLGKIIAGAVSPDDGTIHVEGEEVRYRSPREAIRAGIALIDQELATVREMSVLDNVFLGAERVSGGLLDRGTQTDAFRELSARVGFEGDPRSIAGTLRTADQQQIEIMRALVRGARLIVMDEPTAALSRVEADRLLQVARDLRDDEGVTIIFVSHFLEDVLSLADNISVLKDGRHVKTTAAAAETTETLITAMLGRSLDYVFPEPAAPPAEAPTVLKVRGLTRAPAFADVSFDIRAGEIVGLAGLVGSGRTEIARGIFGADPASGTVEVDGRTLRSGSPRQSIRAGVALLPESRKDQGLAMHRSVAENVSMVHLDQVCGRGGVLQTRRERRLVDDMLGRVRAKVATPSMDVSGLSGGNQQKVALAKWLVRAPKLLIADEPTRGVDVGAKQTIYEILKELAQSGMAVLLISSEIEEVLGLAHRVLVVRTGRIVAEFEGDAMEEEAIMRAAFGDTPGGNANNGGSPDAG
jgi:ABC-type sugar transport system ATPase subunit